MSLSVGDRLGNYEIVAELGAGGMGEVYRARDTKLDREVAVKVLPDAFSRDAERIARFEREAKLLAALNHPNIATLFGLEEASGRHCLVMELVRGETLAERIARGPLPIRETVELFRQIADGLETAHEQGVLHRDLKPANIKIASDGTIRILDFGLAKTLVGTAVDRSQTPTVTKVTGHGVIVGTPSYMSPEQSSGEAVDRRTDVWAFGCCLFEALAGHKAFEGASVPDVLAAITRDDPPWTKLPSDVPGGLLRLLRRCLSKDPLRRLRHMGDVKLELDEVFDQPPAEPERERTRRVLYSILAMLTCALGASALTGHVLRRGFEASSPRGTTHLQIAVHPGPMVLDERPSLAISPDGSHVAYVGTDGGTSRLYVRSLHDGESHAVEGSTDANGPFFSADGLSLGFLIRGEMRRSDRQGSSSQRIMVGSAVTRGVWWSSDGLLYLTPTNAHGIYRATIEGDLPEIVSSPDPERNERSHTWPQTLPGNESVVVTVDPLDSDSYESARVAILDTESKELKTLVEGGYHGRVAPSGHLLYVSRGNLMAAPLSISNLEVTGESKVVVPGVSSDARTGNAQYSVSESGTLVYVRGGPMHYGENRLVWVDRSGEVEPVSLESRVFGWPSLSPNGARVAFSVAGTSDDIWVLEFARGTLHRVTYESRNFAPLWTLEGSALVFSSTRGAGIPKLWQKSADGSGEAIRIVQSRDAELPGTWSRDGALVFNSGVTQPDVAIASPDGTVSPLLASRFQERSPTMSPDGSWLAYVSDETGTPEVYVQRFPELGEKTPVSRGGGTEPLWSPRGDELFYRKDDTMMAVPIHVRPALRVGEPVVLFEGSFAPNPLPSVTSYDVASDARRFLMLEPVEQPESPGEIQVVLNWFDELERLVPTGK